LKSHAVRLRVCVWDATKQLEANYEYKIRLVTFFQTMTLGLPGHNAALTTGISVV